MSEWPEDCLECQVKDNENKELRTRVAELEKEEKKCHHSLTVTVREKEELQNRLSTLLKASEGMEKALEKMDKEWNDFNKIEQGHQCEAKVRLEAVSNRAKQALADFRAVKAGILSKNLDQKV